MLMGICANTWAVSTWNNMLNYLQIWPISSIGWNTPFSLLTALTKKSPCQSKSWRSVITSGHYPLHNKITRTHKLISISQRRQECKAHKCESPPNEPHYCTYWATWSQPRRTEPTTANNEEPSYNLLNPIQTALQGPDPISVNQVTNSDFGTH